MQSYAVGEWSSNAGGLVRWPIKLLLPVGFALIAVQGLSELIKRVAALQGYVLIDAKYERPMREFPSPCGRGLGEGAAPLAHRPLPHPLPQEESVYGADP